MTRSEFEDHVLAAIQEMGCGTHDEYGAVATIMDDFDTAEAASAARIAELETKIAGLILDMRNE